MAREHKGRSYSTGDVFQVVGPTYLQKGSYYFGFTLIRLVLLYLSDCTDMIATLIIFIDFPTSLPH